ncbi:MAG: isoprenylcysteine carboxylmethyltransferase family protein [Phycisphaerales bacterium]|nr:isoprenylcysteine carboxylmethyltransferase family protein [Phycisphaerales bacterium]
MRFIPPVWFLLSLIAIFLVARFVPSIVDVNIAWHYAGYIIIGAAIGIIIVCSLEFKKHQTTIHPSHTPTALIQSGPYSFSRNPIYLAMAIILIGCTIVLGNLVALPIVLVFVGVITLLFIEPEEKTLKAEFGVQYEHYCNSTHRWI